MNDESATSPAELSLSETLGGMGCQAGVIADNMTTMMAGDQAKTARSYDTIKLGNAATGAEGHPRGAGGEQAGGAGPEGERGGAQGGDRGGGAAVGGGPVAALYRADHRTKAGADLPAGSVLNTGL